MKRPNLFFSGLAAFCVIVLACGQKPGTHVATAGSEGAAAGEGLAAGEAGGEAAAAGAEGAIAGPAGAAGAAAKRKAGSAAGAAGAVAGKGDRTGVTADKIVVGLHAPVTGAAPFPAASFEKGKDLYWTRSGAPKVHGRTVQVLFQDDQYSPFTAVDRCRKMAEQQRAFLLIGGGGTDQVQACARYAATKGIPYLSAGVTEVGLKNLRNYFAISMSYAQQGPLLSRFIKERFPGITPDQVGMIRTNTPNFQDAHDAFKSAFAPGGLKLDRTLSKNPSATEYDDAARAVTSSQVKVLYVLTAPTHYVQLTAASRMPPPPPGSERWFVGVGITKGLDDVLATGCNTSGNQIQNAYFLSPFPGVASAKEMDGELSAAYGGSPDSLGTALWGLNKTLHQMLEKAGPDLSRQSFILSTEKASIQTNLFPPLQYSQTNHFGGSKVHVLKANCSTKQHETYKTFYP